jgi:hypothetical protein
MRTTADQAVDLAKQTPHRVMRELYEQFIAYGRAYADSLGSYTSDDDFFSQANISLSSAISSICDAIDTGGVVARSAAVSQADPPSNENTVGDPADPQRFLTEPVGVCAKWVSNAATFEGGLREWELIDPKIPATEWTPEQRAIQDRAAELTNRYADDVEKYGRSSGNPIFEDFSVLAALYFRAYSLSTPTYTVADNYLMTPGLRLGNAITAACQASVG